MKISSKQSFTILELTIVLAVLGLMTLLAIPNYQTFMTQRRLNGAARQVMSDLVAARMQAITLSRAVRIEFSLDYSDCYTLDAAESALRKNIQANYYDVMVKASLTPLIFHPDGAASNLVIKVCNARGDKTITISRVGRIKIN